MILTLGKGRKTILRLYLVFPVCASVWNLAIHHNRVCRWSRGVLGRVQKHEIPTDFVIMTISPWLLCSSSSSSEWVQEVWGGGERCRRGRRLSKGPKVNIVPSRGKIIALSLIIVIVFFNILFIVQSSSLVLFNLLLDPRSIFWIVSHHQSTVILTTRQNMLELMSRCFQTSLNRFGQSTMVWITHRPPTRRLVETNQGVWAPP